MGSLVVLMDRVALSAARNWCTGGEEGGGGGEGWAELRTFLSLLGCSRGKRAFRLGTPSHWMYIEGIKLTFQPMVIYIVERYLNSWEVKVPLQISWVYFWFSVGTSC